MSTAFATELAENAGFMNLKAFKKRRGRPPKYLDIWRQEHLMKMAAENKIDRSVATKLQGLLEGKRLSSPLPAAQTPQEEQKTPADNTVSGHAENRGQSSGVDATRPRSDEMIRVPREGEPEKTRPRSVEQSAPLSPDSQPLGRRHTTAGVLERESLLGIPSSRLVRQKSLSSSYLNQSSTIAETRTSSIHDVRTKDDDDVNNNVDGDVRESPILLADDDEGKLAIDEGRKLPNLTGAPVKRRPGRPPGSTKKFKAQNGEEVQRDPTTDAFSLRKFFEAGGRDYNEYLVWLEKKNMTPSSPGIPTTRTAFRQAIPHVGGMTGFNLPSGHPFLTQSRQPTLLNPRSPVLLNPKSPVLAVSPPAYIHARPPLPGPHHSPPMHEELIHCHSLDQRYRSPIIVHLSPSPETPASPEMEVQALDLSAKRSPVAEQPAPSRGGRGGGDGDVSTPASPFSEVHSSGASDVSSWNVEQVVQFVAAIPGCQDYAGVFREQMIDGATLPHLSEDHLLKFVSMKLGPAIRLKMAVAERIKSQPSRR